MAHDDPNDPHSPYGEDDPLDAEWEALMGPGAPGTPFVPRRKTPPSPAGPDGPAGARPGPQGPAGARPGRDGPEAPGGPPASALAALDELAKPPAATTPRPGPLARLLHRAHPTGPAQPWQHWFYTSGAWIGADDWKNHRGPLTHDQRRLAHIGAALALTLLASATASALLWHWTNPPLPPPNGAQATAYHALALADYTWNTGDTTPLHDLSAPECQWCAQTTTDTTTTYTTGGWAANAWHTNTNPTNTTTTPNTTTTNTYTTTLTTTQRTPDIYARGTMTPHAYRTTTVKVDLRWDGSRWLLAEFVPLHASGADPSDPVPARPAPSHSGAPRSAPSPTSPRSAPSPTGAPAGVQTPTPPEPGSSAPGTGGPGGPGGPSAPEPTATSWSQSPPAPDDPRAEPDPTDPNTAGGR